MHALALRFSSAVLHRKHSQMLLVRGVRLQHVGGSEGEEKIGRERQAPCGRAIQLSSSSAYAAASTRSQLQGRTHRKHATGCVILPSRLEPCRHMSSRVYKQRRFT